MQLFIAAAWFGWKNMQHLFFQTIFNFSDPTKEIWQLHVAIIFRLVYLRNTAGCSSVSIDSLKLFLCKSHVVPAVPRRVQTSPLTFWKKYKSVHDTASTTWSNHAILPVAAFPWELNLVDLVFFHCAFFNMNFLQKCNHLMFICVTRWVWILKFGKFVQFFS